MPVVDDSVTVANETRLGRGVRRLAQGGLGLDISPLTIRVTGTVIAPPEALA
jgi:hypothetical protein